MVYNILAMMMVGLSLHFMSGAESAPCPASTVAVHVTSAADIQDLTDALSCTGRGVFNVTWHQNLTITQTINLSDRKNVTVTGAGRLFIRGALADGNNNGEDVDAGRGNVTGIFSVSNGSTLRLNQLVLDGGNADYGGAVALRSSSSLFVSSCAFENNNASNGGAVYASSSAIYVAGHTSFSGNSAESGGALYASSGSNVAVDGNSIFANNFALIDGGALYASMNSSIDVDGDSIFCNNSVGNSGGAISLCSDASVKMEGSTSFVNNTAGDDGGAMSAIEESAININGNTSFVNNVATESGGALYSSLGSSIDVDANAMFRDNSVGLQGGALSAFYSSKIEVSGNASFHNNSATMRGGAIYLFSSCWINIDGITSFRNNTAGDDGGALCGYSEDNININGNVSFVNNVATERGGAIYASDLSSVIVNGNSIFANNTAVAGGGAMYMGSSSSLHIRGSTSIVNNSAEADGGGMSAVVNSSIYINGDNRIYTNSADNGGAAFIVQKSLLNINGNTSFHRNSVRSSGGSLYVSESETYIGGHTSVTYSKANSPGGGAVFSSRSAIIIDGPIYINSSSAYDGGAILALESEFHIMKNAIIANNSAIRDGGAMKATQTNLTIGANTQGPEGSMTSASQGGAVPSALRLETHSIEGVIFIGNTAFDYGGAISIAAPLSVSISNVTFYCNDGGSGGAVALISRVPATAEFQSCRFEYSKATRGGAMYLSGEGQTFVQGSFFRYNVAEETGGALQNAMTVEIQDTVFVENTAADGGLAIQNDWSAMVLSNVAFNGNILSCPADTYSYTQKASADSCRFELACTQCLDGCESDLSDVTIDTETLPTCEPIPEGVRPSSTATTLQSLDIQEGYYRISTESTIVLECYQKDACVGGVNFSDYCAIGYEGPYCAVCTEGYAPGSSNRCHKCSGENKQYVVGVSTILLTVAMVVSLAIISDLLKVEGDRSEDKANESRSLWQGKLSRLREILGKTIKISAIRIVVVVFQIVAQFTEVAGAVYPDKYEAFLESLALVNLDIGSLLYSSCMLRADFYDRLVLSTVAPLVILLACVGTFFISKMRNQNSSTALSIVKNKHLSVGLFVVFFVYSSVSFIIFQTFVCDLQDDGNAYLRADYSIVCFTETHDAYVVYAGLMAFVYPLGIPAFFWWWLVRNRRDLAKPGRETMPHLQPFRCLWAAYKPSSFYYEVVECGRRIVLTGAAVFVLPDTAKQVAVVLFLAVVFMFVSESISPFESKSDMWLYRWGNGIILASMYVSLILKVELAVEDSRSAITVAVLLIAANLFMFFALVVQTVLLMRDFCKPGAKEEPTIGRASRIGARSNRVATRSEE